MAAAEETVTLRIEGSDELVLAARPPPETMRLIRQEWNSPTFQQRLARAMETMYRFECAICRRTGFQIRQNLQPGQSVNFTKCKICDDFYICNRKKCRRLAYSAHEARMPEEDEEGESHDFIDHQLAVIIGTGGLQNFIIDHAVKATSVGMCVTEAFAEALKVKKREICAHVARSGIVSVHAGAFIKLFTDGIFDGSIKTFGKAGVAGVLVVTALEVAYAAYELYKTGDWKKFWKQTGRAIFTNATALLGGGAGGYAGSSIGAAIGTAICPGVGTAIGGIVGASIGGIIGQFFAAYAAGKAYDYVIPPSDTSEEKVKLALKEALAYFDLILADLDNPTVFCADEINRKYRELAKTHHPDYPERGGSHEKFILLSTYYGLLKAALNDRLVKEKAKEVAKPKRALDR